MIKWQIIVTLPDDLNLGEAVKMRQAIEKSSGLPATLKLERITPDNKPDPEGRQGWLFR